jgi:hypothetical protein
MANIRKRVGKGGATTYQVSIRIEGEEPIYEPFRPSHADAP